MPEVIARSLERRQTQVIVQGHSFIVDEGTHNGGDGLGPSPLGLLMSALAA